MKLFVKNMVSIRCKNVVKHELENMGIHYCSIDLGQVEMKDKLNPEQRIQLQAALSKQGLELMDDKKAILIEKIKNVIIEMVHYTDEMPKVKNSVYIGGKLIHDYTYLSNLFSEVTGITIEQYIIANKIERVKELLLYDELSLTQIAYNLGYSSTAHLSTQFKKVTGLTPSFFKNMKYKRSNNLENM
jgi:YesN/AraC family two-component response regulator